MTATVGAPGATTVRPEGRSSRSGPGQELPRQSLEASGRISRTVQAVSGVSLHRRGGQTLGLVGESGCGKSTIGRCVLRLHRAHVGLGQVRGPGAHDDAARSCGALRRDMQIVFQDPYASLDPRMTVGAVIAEPLEVHKIKGDHKERVAELLRLVGLIARARQPLPPRVLRRPAPAHRHRPGAGPRPVADRARRAGVGARRVDPGRRRQPAARTCRTASGWPTSSSPTTCRWCATSPTGWP